MNPSFVSATAAASGADVTVSWHKLGHVNAGEILIVECNYNVFSGDPAACDETPSNLDMPGGPWYPSIIVEPRHRGTHRRTYSVRVDSITSS